jgi:glycosidase
MNTFIKTMQLMHPKMKNNTNHYETMKRTFTIKICLAIMIMILSGNLSTFASSFVGNRTDFRDETIYFVITTRFYDGDASNNTQCWDNQTANYGDPAWRGDFKGLIDRLDYIKALGFTAIWITPIVENASGYDYHGYHARNFSCVDKRYESSDVSFQTLIDAAHKKGMKIILDIVLNHTGNFGEENLCKEFTRDWSANQADINSCMLPNTVSKGGILPDNYSSSIPSTQYGERLALMKNTDGINHDTHNYWHHFGNFNWDNETRWWAQIAGDCVDLNTENPKVYNYLINCYGSFIKMGVDGFRIDTGGHISRLTFNKAFVPAFYKLGEQYKDKRLNGCPFYMYTEVCARFQGSVTYRGQPALSPYFYTWNESKDYAWDSDENSWENVEVPVSEGLDFTMTNMKSCEQQYKDNPEGSESGQPVSNNVFLNGNDYHAPDVSKASGLNVIDFPIHYSFNSIGSVWGVATGGDKYYNDASYNVVYVDSHDYGPGPNDGLRFTGGTSQWAENMDFMFTFRGIPCLYYGSEIEFRKGSKIDDGTNSALKNTGRAYYGGYIKGSVTTTDFGQYTNATGNVAATLNHPLAKHLQRLNRIRAAVPALRKGQYSIDGCTANGGYAYKRRYTDSTTDSYALITINGGATFTGILNGTYTDCVTGDVKTVTGGTLTASCSGQGNMRVYVLSTTKTPAPGKIGEDGPFLFNTTAASTGEQNYDGTEEEASSNNGGGGGGGGGNVNIDTLKEYTPAVGNNELSVFYEASAATTNVTCWVWNTSTNFTGGSWPGQNATLMGKTTDGTKKIFKWTFTGTASEAPTKIIFSNAGQNQTADLSYVNHGYYVEGEYKRTIDGNAWNPTDPTPTPSTDTMHAYFIAPSNWTDVYCWAWDAKNGNYNLTGGTWPGVKCTKTSATSGGLAIWEWINTDTSGKTPTLIIFSNNGKPQTDDMTFENGAYYTSTGKTTGITAIESDGTNALNIYNICGMRISNAANAGNKLRNLPKGLYIINGKKYVIK